MKKIITCLTIVAAFAATDVLAFAPDLDPYVSGKVGFVYTAPEGLNHDLFGANVLGAVGVNYKANWNVNIRQELEASYALQAGRNTNLVTNTFAGMANLYFDFGRRWTVRPYVGAGLGIASVIVNPKDVSAYSAFGFNWGLYAGLNIDLSYRWTMDLGLRYTEVETKHASDFPTYGLTLGMRYQF